LANAAFGLMAICLGISLFFFTFLAEPTIASMLGPLLDAFLVGLVGIYDLRTGLVLLLSPIFLSIAFAIYIYIGPAAVTGLIFLTTFFFFLVEVV
jgi:hypothetical protein